MKFVFKGKSQKVTYLHISNSIKKSGLAFYYSISIQRSANYAPICPIIDCVILGSLQAISKHIFLVQEIKENKASQRFVLFYT